MRSCIGCGRDVRGRCCRTTFRRNRPFTNTLPAGGMTELGSVCTTLCESRFENRRDGKRRLRRALSIASRPRRPRPVASGYDAGKKVNGRKRHIVVDTLGLLIAVVITAASVQDRDGAKLVFEEARGETRLKKIWADGGYAGKLVGFTAEEFGWDLEIVKRSDDVKGFKVLPHRWVVERTFGWLGRYRLFCREHEATIASSRTDIHLAMTHIMLRRLTRPPKPVYKHEHLLAHIA